MSQATARSNRRAAEIAALAGNDRSPRPSVSVRRRSATGALEARLQAPASVPPCRNVAHLWPIRDKSPVNKGDTPGLLSRGSQVRALPGAFGEPLHFAAKSCNQHNEAIVRCSSNMQRAARLCVSGGVRGLILVSSARRLAAARSVDAALRFPEHVEFAATSPRPISTWPTATTGRWR